MTVKLPTEMKAARITERKLEYSMQTIPLPIPQPREILVKVAAAGFCHTDALMPIGDHGGPLPMTGSHEPSGVVVGMGEEAERIGKFKVGDRIMAVNTFRACKECGDCKRYHERWCSKAAMIGLRWADGAFAEYCLTDVAHTEKIPDGMSFAQAATFSCAGVTIYHSIKKAGLKKGDALAIIGMGALGLVGVQMAKALGYKVVGVDARDGPYDAASALKDAYRPDIIVNTAKTTAEETMERIKGLREPGHDWGHGVDAVCMATGGAQSALDFALAILRPHGTIVLTSGPNPISIPILDFIWKDFIAVGTQNGPSSDMLEAAELCVKCGIKSNVKLFEFSQEVMKKMVEDVHKSDWSGKAVVAVDRELCKDDLQ